MPNKNNRLIGLSDEMNEVVDLARGDQPLSSFVEQVLARSRTVRETAKTYGVVLPKRKNDARRQTLEVNNVRL